MPDIGVKLRQECERKIAKRAIQDLLGAGFAVSVNDGEEETVTNSHDAEDIFAAMFTTDEDYLIVRKPPFAGNYGWVRFIYGNDGPDVINDFTTNLEPVLAATLNLAEAEEERLFG